MLPGRAARHQQTRHIAATHQQKQSRNGCQQHQRALFLPTRPGIAGRSIPTFDPLARNAPSRRRKLVPKHLEIAVRAPWANSGTQPPNQAQGVERSGTKDLRQTSDRHVEVGVVTWMRAKEPGRHDAYDREWHIVQVYRPAQHVRGEMVAAVPEAVAGHRHARSSGADVVGESESASQQRRFTQHLEEVAGYRFRFGRALDLLPFAALVGRHIALRRQTRERPVTVAQEYIRVL